MKTDIQIAQEAEMANITDVAAQLGISEDDLELYGKYKAKLSNRLMEQIKDRKDGKLILVTAINPTPAGEGKTTTSVGLGEAFGKMGKKAVLALREPSLGPCFGIKGGAAFYRGLPRHHVGEQPARRAARQPHPAGQRAGHRPEAGRVEALHGHERPRAAQYRCGAWEQGGRHDAGGPFRHHRRVRDHGGLMPGGRYGGLETAAWADDRRV